MNSTHQLRKAIGGCDSPVRSVNEIAQQQAVLRRGDCEVMGQQYYRPDPNQGAVQFISITRL